MIDASSISKGAPGAVIRACASAMLIRGQPSGNPFVMPRSLSRLKLIIRHFDWGHGTVQVLPVFPDIQMRRPHRSGGDDLK